MQSTRPDHFSLLISRSDVMFDSTEVEHNEGERIHGNDSSLNTEDCNEEHTCDPDNTSDNNNARNTMSDDPSDCCLADDNDTSHALANKDTSTAPFDLKALPRQDGMTTVEVATLLCNPYKNTLHPRIPNGQKMMCTSVSKSAMLSIIMMTVESGKRKWHSTTSNRICSWKTAH